MDNKNILFIGQHTQAYLYAVAYALQREGFSCKVIPVPPPNGVDSSFTLTVMDYAKINITVTCRCCELEPTVTEVELLEYKERLKGTHCVIVVLPIKSFAYHRYNVDDILIDAADRITPIMLRRIVLHMLGKDKISLSWVVVGAEQVTRTLTNPSPIDDISSILAGEKLQDFPEKASEIVNLFFSKNEEKFILEEKRENEIISFGFLQDSPVAEIGEKVCTTWNVQTFFAAIKGILEEEETFISS